MSRKLVLAGVVLVLTIILVGVIAPGRFAVGRRWMLPDGNEIALVAVTSGPRHEFVLGKRLRDRLYQVLPARWAARLGTKVATQTVVDTNSVVLWFRYQHAPTPTAATFPPLPCQVTVVDGAGVESEPVAGAQSVFYLSAEARLHALEVRHLPRRSHNFRVRLYTRDFAGKVIRLGEAAISRSVNGSAKSWVPEDLPAAQGTNGLVVTLAGFTSRIPTERTSATALAPDAHSFCRAVFQIAERGQPAPNWWVNIVSLNAATGEQLTPAAQAYRSNEMVVLDFPAALWREEPAWKMRVRLSRSGRFPAEELWRFPQVPLPGSRQVIELNARTNMFGEEVEFLGISSPRAPLPSEWIAIPGKACLQYRFPAPLPGLQFVLVSVRDDHDRAVPWGGMRQEFSTGGRGATMREINRAQALEIPADARSLAVTFALSRELDVEFVVHPDH